MTRHVATAVLILFGTSLGQWAIGQGHESYATSALHVGKQDLLTRPVAENWPSYNGDYTGGRFSSLREINRSNVAQMRAAWVFHPGNSQSLEATPVVIRGVMFVTAANDVFALDARTGRQVWRHSRP